MILMCVGSIGVIYGGKCMKNGGKYTFWAIFGDMYRYNLNMYRYILASGHFGPTCTGTC